MKIIYLIMFFSFSLYPQQEFIKVIGGLNFPEGPAWDYNNYIYVSNCYGGFITRVDLQGNGITFVDSLTSPLLLKQTNGLTADSEGNIYACDYGIGAILKITPAGEIAITAAGYEGAKFNRPNDLAFDKEGKLYFTDPKSYGRDKLDGRIFKLDVTTGEAILVASGLAFPNGIAFNATGNKLYVAESAFNRIISFDVDSMGGLNNKEIFIELPGGDPDGLAFDEMGNLYVAHFGGGNIYIISPSAEIISVIAAPGKKPSNVEFAGADFKTLYVTETETNALYKIQTEIPGLKLFNKR
jgi:gluconolactonase